MSSAALTIEPGRVATFHYVLRDEAGTILDQSDGAPMPFLCGAQNIIPGLEAELIGKSAGDKLDVRVPPEQAYGVFNPDAVQKVHRSNFPKGADIQEGAMFQANTPEGHTIPVWVVGSEGAFFLLSANHPLAGKTLHFAVTIAEVREATAEEQAHGHVHGPGGHHHH